MSSYACPACDTYLPMDVLPEDCPECADRAAAAAKPAKPAKRAAPKD